MPPERGAGCRCKARPQKLFSSSSSLQGCGVGVGGVACFQLESESGVGFQNCWSWSLESVF